ncbi:PH domain-containing protein [Alphaproteobacteria bacterium GH1-50]|uniref:PH domain-containing protein n=1 Tax=Kangsaoukella pontilimi TaxID=2691042 RepID=A0A7C9ITG7_9RHOB|nr:photosynthetic complex putative assembly protein PuhB [Kangsaoukella pontilimi]MXQ09706.1 PH domain-containing protein [Kangsaoukella pontilimi]
MPHDDDVTVEPVKGLPEDLPPGEVILWQGRPSVWPLLREALSLNWVLGYFALLIVWRVGVSTTTLPLGQALLTGLPFLILAGVVTAILYLIALAQARATVYTITSERIAMRIGAALTITLNLPFPKIAAADLSLSRNGTGTIALRTMGQARLSYMILWPHVRPWHLKETQPALRCIPDAAKVAAILAEAAETRVSRPTLERVAIAHPGAVAAE